MHRIHRQIVRRGLACALLALGGCVYSGSTDYVTPPTVVGARGPVDREASGKRVVVIGQFRNPAKSSLQWKDIGSGMSNALARTLLNRGEFDVWVNPQLSREVENILAGPLDQQSAQFGRLQQENEQVRFVITGQVTDFHHTAQLPPSLRRNRGRASEALVAMQINIVDLHSRRQVVADHVYGLAPAHDAKESVKDLYAGVSMSSYLFWSTPLGGASKQAIERTMERLNRLVPTSDESVRIVRHVGPRRVKVSGGAAGTLRRGAEYFVCVYDERDGKVHAVLDEHTRLPMRARIEQTGRLSTTAWLLGRQPVEVDLRGAFLSGELPADAPGLTPGTATASTTPSRLPSAISVADEVSSDP